MGNRFSVDDLESWEPKTNARKPPVIRKLEQTQEYNKIYSQINKNVLHLTREPSKLSRLNYMHALCDILNDSNIGNDKVIESLSLWNWRFLGSNEKYIYRLARALQNNSHIQTLHLVNCHIDCPSKLKILIESLKYRDIPLKDIDLSGNNFGNDENAIKLLGIFLSTYECTKNVEKITLRATKLQDKQFTNFINILSQSNTLVNSLKVLSVTHNKLKSHSMHCLTQWLLTSNRDTNKILSLALTNNPLKDSGIKNLLPLIQSDICISELYLRGCNITSRGIIYLFDAYLIRQQRVIYQHTKLIYSLLDSIISIPFHLCSIIVEFITDWTLDNRLSIHFGLSRCSLLNMDGFNTIIDKYIIGKKLIAKCIDIRMKQSQNTEINVVNIYKLFHYLKYARNGCIGRLTFCVGLNKFNITNKIMQMLTVNITEMDIDVAINDMNIACISTNNNNNNNMKKQSQSHEIVQDVNNLNIINDIINQNQKQYKKQKMEDILKDDQDENEQQEEIDDNEQAIDMTLLEELGELHVKLKKERLNICGKDEITFRVNTHGEFGDFDVLHKSYIDLYGDPIGDGFIV